jgi:hypothetical protein
MSKPEFDTFVTQSIAEHGDIKPDKNLWPGIERAINREMTSSEKASYWPKITGVAACFVAGLVTWQVIIEDARYDTMASMSHFFEKQKHVLLVKYDTQPAIINDWQIQLTELESAEQAVKLALKNDPENAALLKMLAQVYQQQLDLINKVHKPRWQQV